MIEFPDRPRLELTAPGQYLLVEDYRYQWAYGENEYRLDVQLGFETDLASIPDWLHSLIGPQGLGLGPPLIHDSLYKSGGRTGIAHPSIVRKRKQGSWIKVHERWSRHDADRIFGRFMRERGIGVLKRRSAYLAVRSFGWFAWPSK